MRRDSECPSSSGFFQKRYAQPSDDQPIELGRCSSIFMGRCGDISSSRRLHPCATLQEAPTPKMSYEEQLRAQRGSKPPTLRTSIGCTNIQAEIPLAPAIPKLRAVGIPLEGPVGALVAIFHEQQAAKHYESVVSRSGDTHEKVGQKTGTCPHHCSIPCPRAAVHVFLFFSPLSDSPCPAPRQSS